MVGHLHALHMPYITNLIGDDVLRLHPWGIITTPKMAIYREGSEHCRELGAFMEGFEKDSCEYVATKPELSITVDAETIFELKEEIEALLGFPVMKSGVDQIAVLKQLVLTGRSELID